jgi:molybdenum cofactor cytidylyltransferase
MISAIILAAGRSERMHTQKLLLPFGTTTVIGKIVDDVLNCPVDEVLVVVGEDESAIKLALAGRPVRFVKNPLSPSDMLQSVRVGLTAVSARCQAALIVLGDQPGVSRTVVGDLIDAFHKTGKGIAIPTHGQKRGHPVLIAIKYCEEVLTRYDGVGLRGLMRAHHDDIVEIETPTGEVLEDMDTPSDYEKLRVRRGQ